MKGLSGSERVNSPSCPPQPHGVTLGQGRAAMVTPCARGMLRRCQGPAGAAMSRSPWPAQAVTRWLSRRINLCQGSGAASRTGETPWRDPSLLAVTAPMALQSLHPGVTTDWQGGRHWGHGTAQGGGISPPPSNAKFPKQPFLLHHPPYGPSWPPLAGPQPPSLLPHGCSLWGPTCPHSPCPIPRVGTGARPPVPAAQLVCGAGTDRVTGRVRGNRGCAEHPRLHHLPHWVLAEINEPPAPTATFTPHCRGERDPCVGLVL